MSKIKLCDCHKVSLMTHVHPEAPQQTQGPQPVLVVCVASGGREGLPELRVQTLAMKGSCLSSAAEGTSN